MDDATFRGECSRCAGLCCLALGFDRGPHFGFDKPAGEACRHLGADHRCCIHERLGAEGMSGCARSDCAGAGQIVTAMFAGLSWRRSDSVRRAMLRAFAAVRELQLLRLTLRRVASAEASRLEARLRAALRSYAALLAVDLLDVRRVAVVLIGGAATCREPPKPRGPAAR
jgi:hypothetical protein